MTTKYQIINKSTNEVIHESYTDFNPVDKEQLKHLLANTFWTPIFIVHMYLKNPDSIDIKVVKDEVQEQEPIKPKRTYKKKKTNDNDNNQHKEENQNECV